jgi:GNAT superfamily N-acetyltransferase
MKFSNTHLNTAYGQHDYELTAHDPEENVIGSVSYSVPTDSKEVHINHIEVDSKHRGKGVGKSLVKNLIRHNIGHKIHWGMTTDDGSKLRSSLEKGGYKRFFEWLDFVELSDQEQIAEKIK